VSSLNAPLPAPSHNPNDREMAKQATEVHAPHATPRYDPPLIRGETALAPPPVHVTDEGRH
jgi:hypothetical protein